VDWVNTAEPGLRLGFTDHIQVCINDKADDGEQGHADRQLDANVGFGRDAPAPPCTLGCDLGDLPSRAEYDLWTEDFD
jgi:hypothetical protein